MLNLKHLLLKRISNLKKETKQQEQEPENQL